MGRRDVPALERGPTTTSTSAGKVIARETASRRREFVPGRRLDAFDQYYARRTEAEAGHPQRHVRPRRPALGARGPARSTCSTGVAATSRRWRTRSPPADRPLRSRRPARGLARGAALKATTRRPARSASWASEPRGGARRPRARRRVADRRALHARARRRRARGPRRARRSTTGPMPSRRPRSSRARRARLARRPSSCSVRWSARRRRWPRTWSRPATRSRCTATCTATCCDARPRRPTTTSRRVPTRRGRHRSRATVVPPAVRHALVRVAPRRRAGSG